MGFNINPSPPLMHDSWQKPQALVGLSWLGEREEDLGKQHLKRKVQDSASAHLKSWQPPHLSHSGTN